MIFDRNCLISSEALQLLERIPDNTINLVYLDPPWGIFNDNFNSNDSIEELADFISKITQQTFRILKEDGTLLLRWPQYSPLDVRLLVNQVFDGQPRYEVIWNRKRLQYAKINSPTVDHDYFLAYSRSEHPTYNTVYRPLSDNEAAAYSHSDEVGSYKLIPLTIIQSRPTLQFDWRGYKLPPNKFWKYPVAKLEELATANLIHFPTTGALPQLKQYLDTNTGVPIGTTWDDISAHIASRERIKFPLQTPLLLMERIITIASNEGETVLDPFCKCGTTLVAAQSLGRHWIGADNSYDAVCVVNERLGNSCGLKSNTDYSLLNQEDIFNRPIFSDSYREIILDIGDIAKLQKEIKSLSDHIISLKKLMNLDESCDEDRVEEFIEKMGNWITDSIAKQSTSLGRYISEVCSWLEGWDQLDSASKAFLPQAELLYEHIAKTDSKDYSPFIIQYCRALENELLKKLFISYTLDFHNRINNPEGFLKTDLSDVKNKTFKFAQYVRKRSNKYTLGDMNFIMSLTKVDGNTLRESKLLQDFRDFTIKYFNESIVDTKFISQINKITEDFRNKSAHPYILEFEVAKKCREQVRSCLNELIINYRGGCE